mmetsp:Transcript_16386/g.22173  ORF Transcript_16386/g.22173 Transcript_16386/m.22173 type:complete len:99 (+) Transcript_16386:104-400(+)
MRSQGEKGLGRRTKYIWRNKGEDQYKISETFADNPLELSNYLLVRTREHLFLQNKAEGKLKAGSGATGKVYDKISGSTYWEQALKDCKVDLEQKLRQL